MAHIFRWLSSSSSGICSMNRSKCSFRVRTHRFTVPPSPPNACSACNVVAAVPADIDDEEGDEEEEEDGPAGGAGE